MHGVAEWQIVIDQGRGDYRYLESTSESMRRRAEQARDNDWNVVAVCEGRSVVTLGIERAAG